MLKKYKIQSNTLFDRSNSLPETLKFKFEEVFITSKGGNINRF